MVWPAPLRRGDTVALVAASRRVTPAEMRPFIEFARLQGWRLLYEESALYASEGILAGSDDGRLQVLQAALDAPDVRAIWFVRGGHGSSRIWPRLHWEGFQKYPKWLIGFSDVTPFLWGAVWAGVVALHAPVAALVPHRTHIEAVNQLLAFLRGDISLYRLSWKRKPDYAWRPGQATGTLLGGNLTLLQTLCGTSWDFLRYPQPVLLFWEEVGEYYYRLDRMSWHLRNAGWYEKAQGLMIGGLSFMREDEDLPFGRSPAQIVAESTTPLTPLAMGLPVGHTFINWPMPVGASARLLVTTDEAHLEVPLAY